ncbi:MAG TPA: DUF3352 domain-containing protein [Thermosynechococcaceae cyanobacterium]
MATKNLLLPAVGLGVLAAGSAAAYFYFKSPLGDLNPLATAKVIPENAYLAAFISTDQQSWSKLEQFGTPEARQIVNTSIQNFQQRMLADTQLNYDKDLKPWVGNVMVALLPAQAGAQKSQTNMLMVVGIRDKGNALAFAGKLNSQAKTKATESDYKGVKITDFAGEKSSTYTAMVKDFLVVSPEKQTVEKAIDTAQGQPSLASKPDADNLFNRSAEVQNPIARFYVLDYARAVQEMTAKNSAATPLPSGALEQLKQVKSVVGGLGIDGSGLRLKAVANLDTNAKTLEFKPSPGKVISQFPAETFALTSGQDISRIWAQTAEQSKANPDSQKGLDQMRQTTKTIGLDLDKDVFGWMNGEFGLGLVPATQGLFAQLGFGSALVLGTSDRSTAEATLSKLDNLAKSNSIPVQQRDLQGKKVTEWSIPGQGAFVSHGWLDQGTLFVTFGGPADTIANKPAQALDSSQIFKDMTSSLPKQGIGYFYVDMDKTVALINQLSAATQQGGIPPETLTLLNSIKGIGATSVQPNKTIGEFEMLLALKPATK